MTSVSEEVRKLEPLYTIGGNENWYRHYGKQYGGLSNIKNRIPALVGVTHWIER